MRPAAPRSARRSNRSSEPQALHGAQPCDARFASTCLAHRIVSLIPNCFLSSPRSAQCFRSHNAPATPLVTTCQNRDGGLELKAQWRHTTCPCSLACSYRLEHGLDTQFQIFHDASVRSIGRNNFVLTNHSTPHSFQPCAIPTIVD